MAPSRLLRALLALLLVELALLGGLAACSSPEPSQEPEQRAPVHDRPYEWFFQESQDLQLPELPTGCEATATATMLRMHGVPVTKMQMAERMPRSDVDFVDHFMGDPAEYGGNWNACASPCAAWTANRFLECSGWAAFARKGESLDELPLPFVAWVTIDLCESHVTKRSGDYVMAVNNHAVTVTRLTPLEVECVDPLVGVVTYDRQTFQARYELLGEQAVVLVPWD